MKIPFFNKRVEVTVDVHSNPKEVTRCGLIEGTPISHNSFRVVEESFKKYYMDHVKRNTDILNLRLETAKLWVDFIKNATKDIPKENISEIKTIIDPKMDLESVVLPDVYVQVQYISGPGKASSRQYRVYAQESSNSEHSINEILEDVRKFKKELEVKDAK